MNPPLSWFPLAPRAAGALLALALAAPAAAADDPPAQGGACPHHAEKPPPADAPATRDSLYVLPMALTDQKGDKVGLDVHKGHPTVVALFYSSCTSVCPLLIHDAQRLERALSEADRARYRVLLVSLDPERDGPEAFQTLIERHGIDAARWTLATAGPGDVRALAAALGVRYSKKPDGEILHSALLTLLDPEGRIAGRVEGTLQDVDGLAAKVAAMPRAPE